MADESKMFVKTMPITKVYVHRLGFKVLYLKNNLTFGTFFVPMKWFDEPAENKDDQLKGVLIKGTDPAYPYFSIFWYEGKFHSVKLYLKSDLSDETWGNLAPKAGLENDFDIDEIVLNF
jgi:hypothetical protein